MRQAAWGVHRRLAVVLGLWVVFQSLTGFILLFADPIEHWLHPELTHHGRDDRGAAAALAAVRQLYPDDEVGVLATPAVSDGVYVVEVGEREARGSGGVPRSVYVDPAGPRINGTRDHDAGFVALVGRLHRRFLFDSLPGGLSGARVVGALGLAWLVLALTGLITAASHGFGRWWRRDPPVLHRSIGVIVVAPLVLVVVTGIRLALPAGTDRMVATATGSGQASSDVPPPGVRITSEDRGSAPRDATEIFAALRRRYPDGTVARVLMPQPNDRVAPVIAGVSVGFDPGRGEHDYGGNTVVFVDQFTAETLWVGRPDALPAVRQAALLWSRPLHTGSVAGEPGRLLWGWLALAVMVLASAGWATRRMRAQDAHRRQLRWQRQFRRRRALARRQRVHTTRATRAARARRRTSRRLRRRRKIQARIRVRTPGWEDAEPEADTGGEVEIDLTDTVEIDLTDTVDIDLTDRGDVDADAGPDDAPSRFPPA
ncbi:MAG: PepSY domain-containing protein [Actinobacteria bacterium]|nr:PepSY domain-containing protein [Actinomycetota bacterium]